MAKSYTMTTEVGSYTNKQGEEKKSYAKMGKIVMMDDGSVFGEIYDAFNNRTIKFNAFEIEKKEGGQPF